MKRSVFFSGFIGLWVAVSGAGISLQGWAAECPQGSYLLRKVDAENKVQYYCKCLPGRALVGNRCEACDDKVRQTLTEQSLEAMRGLKSSLDSMKFEKRRVTLEAGQEDLYDVKYKLATAVMALTASPDPIKLPTAAALVLGEATLFLSRVEAQMRKDPDIAVASGNAKNFIEIAQNKVDALKNCEGPAIKARESV